MRKHNPHDRSFDRERKNYGYGNQNSGFTGYFYDEEGSSIGSRDFRLTNKGFFGKGPKGWARTDDKIRDEVCEALSDSWKVDASEIDVSVADGTVILNGKVINRAMKREAENCVEQVLGVKDVLNYLTFDEASASGLS